MPILRKGQTHLVGRMSQFARTPVAQVAQYSCVTLLTVFLLSALWEWKVEAWIMPALGLPYASDFENAERWRFILTSTAFAALALLLPAFRMRRVLLGQQQTFAELRNEQSRSESLARHDALTGLVNRRVFIDQLENCLGAADADVSVLLIDLDKFKPVNDNYGHAVGDKVLYEIAGRLRALADEYGAVAARLGGDEFALLITQSGPERLTLLARSAMQVINAPLTSMTGQVCLGAAIGISRSLSDARAAETLLKCADHAMYRAKQTHRNSYQFYEPQYDREQEEHAQLEEDVAFAVAREEIEPYFQPIVTLPGQELVGFEILARWIHPKRGVQLPDTFIPIVERLGLMQDMTFSVLRRAITYSRQWPMTPLLAINVTAAMLEDVHFPERLFALLEELAFPFERLEVEVTEQTLAEDVPAARRGLKVLRERGISVALDDFGTGYSSIYHLTQLAIDKIKIDRSFFDDPALGQSQVISAVLELGKGLRMKTLAEGVETGELAHLLSEQGCDFAQGYYFGKPMSARDARDLFTTNPVSQATLIASQEPRAACDAESPSIR